MGLISELVRLCWAMLVGAAIGSMAGLLTLSVYYGFSFIAGLF